MGLTAYWEPPKTEYWDLRVVLAKYWLWISKTLPGNLKSAKKLTDYWLIG